MAMVAFTGVSKLKQFSASGGLTVEMVLLDDNELPMALTGLDPVNFHAILDGSLKPDNLVGQIVEVSHMDVISVNGKETPKISLDNERLPVVLWGKFASDVNEAITRGEDSIICVLRFSKIKVWKDDQSVYNADNVFDLSLNPDMQETMSRVRVSIARLWKQFSAAGGLTIEMVLIDSSVSFNNLIYVKCIMV
ncbi:hypothetical protein IGI04_023941 [Brassica rapa subsp. trilocularis]|uniref:Replication protein A OB domain-containing protein n=1 Tax=Brassica rapa subsp. trilocularis TaxID=1813537 RepID=A0ABQ7M5A1_BRACM|nr:hypothetical protein IGI04_023941 [Brassica rapa subsp. trilocularis]